MATHSQDGSRLLVDQQAATGKVGSELGAVQRQRIAVMLDESLASQLEHQPFERQTPVVGERPVEIEADAADAFHAQCTVDEDPLVGRRSWVLPKPLEEGFSQRFGLFRSVCHRAARPRSVAAARISWLS